MKLKLSLAALVAVGSFQAINASSLEDAVKNTDISGQIRYRFEDISSGISSNNYRIEANTKTQVNSDVTANTTTFVNATTYKQDVDQTATDFYIKKVFFTYTGIDGLVANAGKQTIVSVFEDNKASGGQGATGTGLAVNYDLGGATLGLARFWNNNTEADGDVTVASLGGNFGGVNASVNFHKTTSTNEMQRVALLANTKIAVGEDATVSVDASYAQVTKKNSAPEGSQYRIVLGTNISGVGIKLGYTANGKDGAAVSIQKDAKANFRLHQAHMDAAGKDAKGIYAALSTKITDSVAASIHYLAVSDFVNVDKDATELLAKVSYKMSKNFKLSSFYSLLDDDNTASKSKKVRVEAKYSF